VNLMLCSICHCQLSAPGEAVNSHLPVSRVGGGPDAAPRPGRRPHTVMQASSYLNVWSQVLTCIPFVPG
jgi:hypothetical protein